MDNHHDVSKHLGPAQKRGGVQPVSGDAPQGRSRAGAFDSPHDHPKNSFPVLSSDAASWEPGGAEVEPSRSGGNATIVPASDYVSTFRGEGVEPDLVALPVGLRFDVSRG